MNRRTFFAAVGDLARKHTTMSDEIINGGHDPEASLHSARPFTPNELQPPDSLDGIRFVKCWTMEKARVLRAKYHVDPSEFTIRLLFDAELVDGQWHAWRYTNTGRSLMPCVVSQRHIFDTIEDAVSYVEERICDFQPTEDAP